MSNTVRGRALTELITRCLREGTPIEIDGLGRFELDQEEVVFQPNNRIRVFLCYAKEDRAIVKKIYDGLQNAGFEPWMDVEKILPGQNWNRAIQQAIDVSDFILIHFSDKSVEKRGYFQTELRHALEVAERMPLEEILLVPVRLSECEVPSDIARTTQYIDLFPDYEVGFKALTNIMTAQVLKRRKKSCKPKRRIL